MAARHQPAHEDGPAGFEREPETGRSRSYSIPPLDRSGLMFGFGLGELVLVGLAATGCFGLLLAGAPVWVYGPLLGLSVVLARRRWPGGLQLLEYWPALRCRLERARSGGWWEAASPWDGTRGGDLPGALAGIELGSVPAAGFGEVGVVLDDVTGRATFVIELEAGSFLLASPAEQAEVLDRWGRVLGASAESGRSGVRQMSCTVLSSQGSPGEHLDFIDRVTGAVLSPRPTYEYAQLVERRMPTTTSHRILFSATVTPRAAPQGAQWGSPESGSASRAGAGAGPSGSLRELGLREVARAAESVMHDLRSLGWAEQHLLDRDELFDLLASCVDPHAGSSRPPLAERGIDAVLGTVAEAGPPVSVVEHRDYVLVNEVGHHSYWVRSWPNHGLAPDWMIRLLSEVAGERRFTVFFRPVPRAESVRSWERDMARHDSATITAAEKGKRVSLLTQRAQRSVADLGEDLMAGFPEVELCALATVSAPDPPSLRQRCDAFESLAVSNGIDLVPLRDTQLLGWRDSTPFGFCPIKPRSPWS